MIIFDPEFEEVIASIRPHLNLSNGDYISRWNPLPGLGKGL